MTARPVLAALALGLIAGGSWGYVGGEWAERHRAVPPPVCPPSLTVHGVDKLQVDLYELPQLGDMKRPSIAKEERP